MISDTIKEKIIIAMKARDELRVSTLKMLSSAIHYEEIKKRDLTSDDNREGTLTEEEEMTVVRKEAKKRKDAIELYERGGADDKANREKEELKILQEYLPRELPDDEVAKIIDEAINKTGAKEMSDMGKVIGMVMGQTKGNVDGKRVSEIVKSKLIGEK
ncbi:GatB/YqeY domain-containing protein [Patescibacteria group bacterium]|nr:GatB/YqeY domain-containing protein [Patescibacteria group bacterium]